MLNIYVCVCESVPVWNVCVCIWMSCCNKSLLWTVPHMAVVKCSPVKIFQMFWFTISLQSVCCGLSETFITASPKKMKLSVAFIDTLLDTLPFVVLKLIYEWYSCMDSNWKLWNHHLDTYQRDRAALVKYSRKYSHNNNSHIYSVLSKELKHWNKSCSLISKTTYYCNWRIYEVKM